MDWNHMDHKVEIGSNTSKLNYCVHGHRSTLKRIDLLFQERLLLTQYLRLHSYTCI